jgi:hypothetical protein
VRCDDLEACLVAHADWLETTGPVGTSRPEIERKLQNNIAAQAEEEARIERLVSAIETSGSSRALSSALSEAEQSLRLLKTFERDLRDRAAMADGPVLRRRLADLKEALTAVPLDHQRVNLALRMLLADATVDYKSGLLRLGWKHGGGSHLRFAPPESSDNVPDRWKAAARFFERNRGPVTDQPFFMTEVKLDGLSGFAENNEEGPADVSQP